MKLMETEEEVKRLRHQVKGLEDRLLKGVMGEVRFYYLGRTDKGTDLIIVDKTDKVARFVFKPYGFEERELPGNPDQVAYVRKSEKPPGS